MSLKLTDMQVFRKVRGGTSIYDKYANRFVVCITPMGRIILSKTVVEALGEPTHVIFRTDGRSTIAISAAEATTDYAYALSKAGGKSTSAKSGYRVLAAGSVLKAMRYELPKEPLAYSVEFHHGAAWLDLSIPPSKV